MKRMWMLVLAGALAAAPVRADERTWGRDGLRGINALQVLVEPVSFDAEHAGVKRAGLRADMELRLRSAGIGIVTDSSVHVPESAVLRLRLDGMNRDLNQGSYHELCLTLELMQRVQLLRDPAVQSVTATWAIRTDGTYLTATLVATVRDALRQAMEHFIDDYLAANACEVRRLPPLAAHRSNKRPEGD